MTTRRKKPKSRAASTRKHNPAVLSLKVEFDRETDGRWIADVPQLPGVMQYGKSKLDALRNVEALALDVIAEQIRHGERKRADAVTFQV